MVWSNRLRCPGAWEGEWLAKVFISGAKVLHGNRRPRCSLLFARCLLPVARCPSSYLERLFRIYYGQRYGGQSPSCQGPGFRLRPAAPGGVAIAAASVFGEFARPGVPAPAAPARSSLRPGPVLARCLRQSPSAVEPFSSIGRLPPDRRDNPDRARTHFLARA